MEQVGGEWSKSVRVAARGDAKRVICPRRTNPASLEPFNQFARSSMSLHLFSIHSHLVLHLAENPTDRGRHAVPQIALWEEYSCKLEAQVHALTSENDALQKRIASVQSSLGALLFATRTRLPYPA